MSESKLVESINIHEKTGAVKIRKSGMQDDEIMYCPLGSYVSNVHGLDFRNRCHIHCVALHYTETKEQKFIFCKQFFDFYCNKGQQRVQGHQKSYNDVMRGLNKKNV